MTLFEELSTLRNRIRQVDADSDLSDSLLYSEWKKARATVIHQEYNKANNLSNWNQHRFCIEMEKVPIKECDCVELEILDCEIVRSKHRIPQPISGNYNTGVAFYTLGYKKLGMSDITALKYEKLDEVKANSVRIAIYNQYVYKLNSMNTDPIYAKAIWEDIVAWQDIQCNTDCKDVYSLETGFSEYLSEMVMSIVLNKLFGSTLRVPSDLTQNRTTNG